MRLPFVSRAMHEEAVSTYVEQLAYLRGELFEAREDIRRLTTVALQPREPGRAATTLRVHPMRLPVDKAAVRLEEQSRRTAEGAAALQEAMADV